jgi:hypothetical protein
MHGDIIASRFHFETRKGLIHAFQFLQAQNVRLYLFEIGEEMLKALSD